MRAAHAGPGAQHPLAGGQRLNTPDRGARRIARPVRNIWGRKNEPDQNRAGLRRGFCFGRGHAARQCRAGAEQLPEPPDPRHRALPRRRHRRHRRARRDRTGRPRLETYRHHRGAAGRQQQYRHIGGRAQRTGWLHVAGHRPGGAGQPDALQGRRLGRAEGPQMRRPRGLESKRGAGPSIDAGQHHQGIRRDRAQEAGRTEFRQSRHRLLDRSERAETVSGRRHQAHQCRLQRPAAGPDRPDDEPDAFRDRLARTGVAAHQGRQREAAGGHDRQTRRRPARRADDCGSGISGSHLRALVWHLCSGGNAGCHRREDQRRHQQGAAESGGAAPARGRQYSGQADAAQRISPR